MKILVTGGSGFLGEAIVKELIGRGTSPTDITIIDNILPDKPMGCYVIRQDIATPSSFWSASHLPYDLVFHCAGLLGSETLFDNIIESAQVNIIGTLNVLNLQRDHGIVIQPNLLGEWLNPYMISKNTAERYGLMYKERYGTKYISIRPTDIYGPGQSLTQKKITPTFICHALKNEPIPIYGDGSQMVRMVFVRDIARFFVDRVSVGMDSVINLSSQQPENYLSVKDYAELIIKLCESSSELEYLAMRPGQPVNAKDVYANISTGPQDEISLHDGLLETIEYYESII